MDMQEIEKQIIFLSEILSREFERYKNNADLEEFGTISNRIRILKMAIDKLQLKLNTGLYLSKFAVDCKTLEEASYLDSIYDEMYNKKQR